MPRGGYRKPNNPAPVSGPGSLSKRTDGGPSDPTMGKQAARYISGLPYGEGQEMMNIQQSAPLAAAPSIEQSNTPSGLASAAASQPIIPLNAPTMYPNQPVTNGADKGMGVDSSALGLINPLLVEQKNTRDYLVAQASQPNASPTLKYLAMRAGISL